MATNYPTNLDTLTNPTATDKVSVVSHADQHANANDAIEALEAKVGVDGSAVTSSHDYKLSNVVDGDKAVSVTGTETITNKTLITPEIAQIKPSSSETLTLPNETDTLVGKNTTDTLTNKTLTNPSLTNPTSTNTILNGTVTGDGVLDEDDMSSNSETSIATQRSIKTYIDNSVSSGTPRVFSSGNTSDVSPSYTDDYFLFNGGVGSQYKLGIESYTGSVQSLDVLGTWASANSSANSVILGDYVYVLLENNTPNPDVFELYRFSKSSITSVGTQITFSGAFTLADTNSQMKMTSDGTNFYFSYKAGNSSNAYEIAKYTLSGTILTYDSTITLSDSSALTTFVVKSNGDIYTENNGEIKKYNSSGTLQETSESFGASSVLNFSNTIYAGFSSSDLYIKLIF